jgi:hypothetical protein
VVTAGAGAHYEIDGLAGAADPRLVAALAAWCAEHGLLLTELRLGSASLEERYLELVGTDVTAEAAGDGAAAGAEGDGAAAGAEGAA